MLHTAPTGAPGGAALDDQRGGSSFWARASIPATNDASERFWPRIAALARRCGAVSGWLLPRISTADTARDLDQLFRVLMGEEKLPPTSDSPTAPCSARPTPTCYPTASRAMLLRTASSTRPRTRRATRRGLPSDVGSADPVFARFLALCDRGAGPERCTLARMVTTRGRALQRLVKQVRRPRTDPGPGGEAAALVAPGAQLLGDTLLSQFQPTQARRGVWPANAADTMPRCAATDRRSRTGEQLHRARRLGGDDDLRGDLLRRRARPPGTTGLAVGESRRLREGRATLGPRAGLQSGGGLPSAPLGRCAARTTTAVPGTPRPRIRSCLINSSSSIPTPGMPRPCTPSCALGNAVLLTQEGSVACPFQNPSACVDQAIAAYLTELI